MTPEREAEIREGSSRADTAIGDLRQSVDDLLALVDRLRWASRLADDTLSVVMEEWRERGTERDAALALLRDTEGKMRECVFCLVGRGVEIDHAPDCALAAALERGEA